MPAGTKTNSPGIAWRKTKTLTVAWWLCRQDIAKRGYRVKSRRLWSGVGMPSEDEMTKIEAACQQLQAEMLDWHNRPKGNKRSRHPNFGGSIYFLKSGDLIKIGFAKNVRRRVSHMQVGSAQPLEILTIIPGTPLDEMRLHRRFKKFRKRGEWFTASPELTSYIATETIVPGSVHLAFPGVMNVA